MKLIDVTVPLDASLPIYPGNTPFTVEAVKRVGPGICDMMCLSLRVVGADGVPARVLLRRR